VDYIAIFHQPDSVVFVRAVKPDFHINDSDYGLDCIEREPVEEQGGRIVVVKKVRCRSTTDIIRAIVRKHGGKPRK
jgi:bifunctional ADP-heptose synthase (sugar kinase/adenylyltransferase)